MATTFVSDQFTGTLGVDVTSRAATTIGGTPSYTSGTGNTTLTGSGSVSEGATPSTGIWVYPNAPASLTQTITATANILSSAGAAIGFVFYVNVGFTIGYIALYDFSTGIKLYDFTGTLRNTSNTVSIVNGDTFGMSISNSGSTNTLQWLHNGSNLGTSFTDTNVIPINNANALAGGRLDGTTTATTGRQLSQVLATYTSTAVPVTSTENIILLSTTKNAIQLQANITSGSGVGTVTYAWYRSTTVNFTPGGGNILSNGGGISGATTATLTDGSALTGGTTYYYVCIATDTGPNTYTWYHRPVLAPTTALKLCAIGDSTEASQYQCNNLPAQYWLSQKLLSAKGIGATLVNSAVSGSASANWWNGSAQTNLTNALAACGGSFTGFYVSVRLGVNDAQAAVSSGTYNTNMTGLVNYITTNGGIAVLNYPTWREPGSFAEGLEYTPTPTVVTFDETTTPLLIAYQSVLTALVNGSTVYIGDVTSYELFSESPQEMMYYGGNNPAYTSTQPPAAHTYLTNSGTIHPNVAGARVMGDAEADAIIAILYPAASILSLTITKPSGNPILVWIADPLATSYNVLRATSIGGPYTRIANPSAGTLTYTDTAEPVGTIQYAVTSNH